MRTPHRTLVTVQPSRFPDADQVFAHAFVDATRVSLLLPIAIIFLAAVASLGVRVRSATPESIGETQGMPETAG